MLMKQIKWQCVHCGATRCTFTKVPLRTTCPKRKPKGLHVWVKRPNQ